MKKIFFLLAGALLLSLSAQAQSMSTNAIGLKFGGTAGDFSGGGVAFSYQRALGGINRFEGNLAFGGNDKHSSFGIDGYYQWVWNIQGGFNWFAAPGVSFAGVNVKDGDNYFAMGIGGQVGLEYRFPIPLQLTLEFNPTFGLLNDQGYYSGFALGVRYMF